MDEYMLNDLLECSVCLERLDTSSRVLPCQHTFCKKCLEEIVSTKKELRCPECRVLVSIKIEELPPNVLLMRILGGMRSSQPKNRTVVHNHIAQPSVTTTVVQQAVSVVQHNAAAISTPDIMRVPLTPKQTLLPNQPYARAVYDYLSNEPGDLKFKKGDIIMLRKKMDVNWYHGESGGNQGVFPLTYVQVITPLPSHIPQCKALYDFRMTNDDEEGCLTFNKGEVITVIRRVDENWAEGKLTDRIGIFPLAFVELNNVARALMKLSTNSQPGPSRLAPPTPTSEDMTPLIPTDHSHTIATSHPHSTPVTQNSATHHHITMGVSDSSTTVSSASSSTTTPNTSSSNTSSSSSTAPSSPTSPPPPRPAPSGNVSSPPPRPAHNPTMSPPHLAHSQNRGKRHSFSMLPTGHQPQPSHRHSAEILTPTEILPDASASDQISQSQSNSGDDGLHRQGSQRHRRSGSSDMALGTPPPPQGVLHTNTQLPAAYIALYPYKPQKADEMELKKGGVYMVTERCQDGWFKGTSNRTQKGGVFPGNYVAQAKAVPGGVQIRSRGPSSSSSPSQSSSPRPNGNASLEPPTTVSYTRSGAKHSPHNSPRQQSSQPPELPPRASSPHVTSVLSNAHHVSPISTSWHGHPQETGNSVPIGRSQSALMPTNQSSTFVSPPPNAALSPRSTEKIKERKDKGGVSLMKRLTSIKKSKSPPPMSTYSMDNPVFDDGSVVASPPQPMHVRSSETGAAGGNVNGNHHRKSNSLDAGDAGRKLTKPIALPVRERFRCIVPYPPNSDYELELRVGDIIYVHKKRDDGWYKGTQQRTGRTGLFPASFVESF